MFNFTIHRDKLLNALTRLIQACEKGSLDGKTVALSHFFCIRFDGYDGSIMMSAGNATRRVEYLFRIGEDYEGTVGPCFGVHGQYFYEIIKSLPPALVRVEVGDSVCDISSSTSRLSLSIRSSDQLPSLEDRPPREWVDVDLEGFFDKVSRITYCTASADHPQTFTRSVCVLPDILVCTNGQVMSIVPNTFIPIITPILIPSDSIQCFSSAFKKYNVGAVCSDDRHLHISTKNIHVTTGLYSGGMPNFHTYIPHGPCVSCTISKERLLSSLRRISIITQGKLIDGPPRTQFEFTSGGLIMTYSGRENSAREEIPFEFTGLTCKIFLNARNVLQAVKSISCDEINIELRGEQFPVVLTDSKGEHKNVIQPIRK